ncbi:MAG: hypothetical protein GEV12_05010 [Micromonosporaceae bacterium]|nr:hypothetical protein [Micromonosporaceae bacterium]
MVLPRVPPRLVATDLDGTLLRPDGTSAPARCAGWPATRSCAPRRGWVPPDHSGRGFGQRVGSPGYGGGGGAGGPGGRAPGPQSQSRSGPRHRRGMHSVTSNGTASSGLTAAAAATWSSFRPIRWLGRAPSS